MTASGTRAAALSIALCLAPVEARASEAARAERAAWLEASPGLYIAASTTLLDLGALLQLASDEPSAVWPTAAVISSVGSVVAASVYLAESATRSSSTSEAFAAAAYSNVTASLSTAVTIVALLAVDPFREPSGGAPSVRFDATGVTARF
jgi:hypothetical protein